MYRLGSCKISYDNILKLKDTKLNSTDIDLYIYLASIQSSSGVCTDLDPKHILNKVLMKESRQTYYNSLYRLQEQGFICIDTLHNQLPTRITLLDNKFETREDDNKKYINVNHPKLNSIFCSVRFKKCKAGTKKLFLLLLVKYLGRTKKLSVKFLKDLCNIKMTSVLNSYLDELQNFLCFDRKGNRYKFIIFPLKSSKGKELSDNKVYLFHKLRGICKLNKVIFNVKKVDDISNVIISMVNNYGKEGLLAALEAVGACIDAKKDLIPAYINKIARASVEAISIN